MSVATKPRGVTNKVTLSPRETELIGQIAAGFNAPSTPDSIVFMTAGTGRKQALTEGLRLIRTALVPSIHLPAVTVPRIRFDRQTVARLASLAVTTLVTVAVVLVGFNLPTIGTSAPSVSAPAVSVPGAGFTPRIMMLLPQTSALAKPLSNNVVKTQSATTAKPQPNNVVKTQSATTAKPQPNNGVKTQLVATAKPQPNNGVKTQLLPTAKIPPPAADLPISAPPPAANHPLLPPPPVVQTPAAGPINNFVGATDGPLSKGGTTGDPVIDQRVAGGTAAGGATPVGQNNVDVSNPGTVISFG